MNKKLMALAVAAALAPAAAMADSGNVTIYGTLNAGFESVDSGSSAAGVAGARRNRVTDNASFIGFKGTEDLGNGTSAVWQVESALNIETSGSSNTFSSRNSFVGLNGKAWGTAIIGRHDTPYKLATGKLDVFADSIGDYNAIMGAPYTGGKAGTIGAGAFDLRPDNVVAYITPTFSGFHAAIAYVAGAETSTGATTDKGNAYSMLGMYENGPFFASLAYERHNIGTAGSGTTGLAGAGVNGKEQHATKLGLGYNFGPGKVGLIYETTKDNFGGALAAGSSDNTMGRNAYQLNGAYTFSGNNTVKLAYTKAGDAGSGAQKMDKSGAKMWAVGVDHGFSKRTTGSIAYARVDNDTNATYTFGHGNSNNGQLAPAGAGADVSGWSVSLKHSF